jgi:hypothetical protein
MTPLLRPDRPFAQRWDSYDVDNHYDWITIGVMYMKKRSLLGKLILKAF